MISMKLLHNIAESPSRLPHIKANYNTREQVAACDEPLSFDGIYKNVHDNMDVLIGKDVLLFVVGDTVGGDNSFDEGMPLEVYCDWNEIMEIVLECKAKLGWHTWSHPDLTTLTYEEIIKEITPPFPMDDFAYPYGKFNDDCIKAVKEVGFKRAWSVTQGNDGQFTLLRQYL
jgi:hypothetical protein